MFPCVTLRVVLPEMLPLVATMAVVPRSWPVARPPDVIVATPAFDDDHVTAPLRRAVVPSLYVPVGLNCCFAFFLIVGLAGVTAMDIKAAGAAVRTVEPTTEPDVAEMVDVPLAATAVARPPELMMVTPGLDDAHFTEAVTSAVEPSL